MNKCKFNSGDLGFILSLGILLLLSIIAIALGQKNKLDPISDAGISGLVFVLSLLLLTWLITGILKRITQPSPLWYRIWILVGSIAILIGVFVESIEPYVFGFGLAMILSSRLLNKPRRVIKIYIIKGGKDD